MQIVYDAPTTSLVFVLSNHVRNHGVYLFRGGKLAHSLELDEKPRISVSRTSVLAIATRTTTLWDLGQKKPFQASATLEGTWIFGEGSDELFGILGARSGAKKGDALVGLVARKSMNDECRLVCANVKGTAAGLSVSAAGDFWIVIQRKSGEVVLGTGDRVCGTARWNKTELGELPDGLCLDSARQCVLVRSDNSYRRLISRIDTNGAIRSWKTDAILRSDPVRLGDRWLFIREKLAAELAAEEGASPIHKASPKKLEGVPLVVCPFDPDTMTAGDPLGAGASLPIRREVSAVSVDGAVLAVAREQADTPILWDSLKRKVVEAWPTWSAQPGTPASASEVSPGGIATTAELAQWRTTNRDLAKAYGQGAHPGNMIAKFEALLGDDCVRSDVSQILYFGHLPVFQHAEHRFVSLLPCWDRELEDWPVIIIDEEDSLSLEGVPDARGFGLRVFGFELPPPSIDVALAWEMFTRPWPCVASRAIEAAQLLVEACAPEESPLHPWLKAMAKGTPETLHHRLIDAALTLATQRHWDLALACAHNALVGSPLDANRHEELEECLVSAAAHGSGTSYRTWLGLVLERRA